MKCLLAPGFHRINDSVLIRFGKIGEHGQTDDPFPNLIGDRHIGGFDDLAALDRQGGLDPLLEAV